MIFRPKWFFSRESRIVVAYREQYERGWDWECYCRYREAVALERDWLSRRQLLVGSGPRLVESVFGLAGCLFADNPPDAAFGRWDMSASAYELALVNLGCELPLRPLTQYQLSALGTICLGLHRRLESEARAWRFRIGQRQAIERLRRAVDDCQIDAPRCQRIAVLEACDLWLEGGLDAYRHGRGLGLLGEACVRNLRRFFAQHQGDISALVSAADEWHF